MSNLVQLDKIRPHNRQETREFPPMGAARRKFGVPDLYVGRLQLTDFRSYGRVTLVPESRSVVLTGPNGAGKTNILEALSFLSPGRGLRGCRLSEVSRLDMNNSDNPEKNIPLGPSSLWAVAARLETPEGTMNLGTGIVSGQEQAALQDVDSPKDVNQRDKRIVRIDGENGASPGVFGAILQVAWLTPQMDRLFIEAPSGRRRFLDRIVANFHSSHMRQVNAYERVMRERNRLLQDGSGAGDGVWLDALEGRMAEHGVAVAAARLDAMDRLAVAIEESTSSFPRAILTARGLLENGLLAGPALAVEDDFRKVLRDGRGSDARSGRAHAGPHKTDLIVHHKDKNMPAALCSTGEQKALLIGITLASARITATSFGAAPILLLDEVAAHLDKARRASLFDELAALGSQVWLTGTDRILFDELDGRACYYQVENSQVTEE
ncbi:DNA recombination and repair protein RecF [hydrothermal vent metagenome]|uniref:DNA recombination and repair protein RecF n=1 Tax=hydrothermal vent metagenome TaxID=652676 RepID=A0A3B1AVF4_9ZZZZ